MNGKKLLKIKRNNTGKVAGVQKHAPQVVEKVEAHITCSHSLSTISGACIQKHAPFKFIPRRK
ncbi:hypothetical protein BBF96_04140 [Anoxybacter fermentans]|uniref:Uncharacterized protein n=1 Tax=Anoxybacter fermentans TaxID=1323375 RepID=A0A3S9SWI5_9FIRM|nr:hypothetical protein [Anoxybacter fermentans]AZR72649.1 hypothetical protein BBF96_04140 [Anoxybacter fermentans]